MKQIINTFKKYSLSFWYFNIMICLFIVLPKVNFILEDLPVRVGLMAFFPIIVLIDKLRNKISFNDNKLKSIAFVYVIFILLTIPSLFLTKKKLNC